MCSETFDFLSMEISVASLENKGPPSGSPAIYSTFWPMLGRMCEHDYHVVGLGLHY